MMSIRTTARTLARALPALLLPTVLHAQDRLVGTAALGTGVTAEGIRFGGSGYMQPGATGRDSVRLRSIAQLSVPVSLAVPLGSQWTSTSSRCTPRCA
jgi:hypothetical protein